MKKYLPVLVVIVTILFSGCSVFGGNDSLSPKAKRALRNGNIYFAQKNLKKARIFMNEVLNEYPENIEANKKMADIFFSDAENNESKEFEFYLKAFDKYKFVHDSLKHFERSEMTQNQRRWYKDSAKKITSIYARILKKANGMYKDYSDKQKSAEPYTIVEAKEKLTNIKSYYYKLTELNPKDDKAFKFLVIITNNEKIELQNNNVDETVINEIDVEMLGLLKKVAEINSDKIDEVAQYAKQLFILKKYEEAVEEFNKIIAIDKYNVDFYDYLSASYDELGNTQAAFDNMINANEVIPENTTILGYLIYYAQKLENTEAFETYSKERIEIEASPKNLQAYCLHLYKVKKYEELLTYAEKWFAVDKKNITAAQFAVGAAQKTRNKNKASFYMKKYKELRK